MKTILIVDDDAKILKGMSLRLASAGYKVLSACDGVEGLSLARSQRPDLIITDIWMPVGVGFSMAFRLKELAINIPIIFLSASKQSNLKNMAQEVHAHGFLEKPYDHNVLLAMVASALGAAEQVQPPPSASPQAAPGTP